MQAVLQTACFCARIAIETDMSNIIDSVISVGNVNISASTPSEFINQIGGSLMSIDAERLVMYRKRADTRIVSEFHNTYRAFGVYCIEFKTKIYIGSTGGGAMYFGRRWKSHIYNDNMHCLTDLKKETPLSKIIFHAIKVCESDSESRFLEYAMLRILERSCPGLCANPLNTSERKQRERNEENNQKRERAVSIGGSSINTLRSQRLMFD